MCMKHAAKPASRIYAKEQVSLDASIPTQGAPTPQVPDAPDESTRRTRGMFPRKVKDMEHSCTNESRFHQVFLG